MAVTRKRNGGAILACVFVLLSSSAGAEPLDVRSDRSDNTFYFTYEGASGEITESSSSARFVRNDPVTFLLYVSEAPEGADDGERLRARFAFELNKRRVVRYRGSFTLEVRNSLGAVAYTDSVERRIVLRPRPGERKKAFKIFFDVPTGSYEAKALFKSS